MKRTKKKKVFVGMSGGVDSSVTAYLLSRRGYDVTGIYIRSFNLDGCGERDAEDARRAAEKIGRPFYVWDFSDEYKRRVVDYMVSGYRAGLTPNPDVMCNKEIKFGIFPEKALVAGADFIATGHYARLKKRADGETRIFQGRDRNKDQTYFLWKLNQKELSRCLFPVGNLRKKTVRAIARKVGLANAEKKDSQGICFLGKIKLFDFLKKYIPEKTGSVVTVDGEKVGEHHGVWFYTIGQRHFDFSPKKNTGFGRGKKPYYVAAKDVGNNVLIVAEGEDNPALFRKEIKLREINFTRPIGSNRAGFDVLCRVRYRQPLFRAKLELGEKSEGKLHLRKPQRFVAEGQSAVFYSRRGELLGGGVIAG
jgi:tRNA-specific 2-thiouridylase